MGSIVLIRFPEYTAKEKGKKKYMKGFKMYVRNAFNTDDCRGDVLRRWYGGGAVWRS